MALLHTPPLDVTASLGKAWNCKWTCITCGKQKHFIYESMCLPLVCRTAHTSRLSLACAQLTCIIAQVCATKSQHLLFTTPVTSYYVVREGQPCTCSLSSLKRALWECKILWETGRFSVIWEQNPLLLDEWFQVCGSACGQNPAHSLLLAPQTWKVVEKGRSCYTLQT